MLVQLTTVASLSQWASTFVYNTMCGMQRVAQLGPQQLRLVQFVTQNYVAASSSPRY